MPDYRLSKQAAEDLADIADYTMEQFGIEQARHYRDGLERCFQDLADNPNLGRSAEQLAPKLRRFEHQSHVVFYLLEAENLLIVRVLHASRDATKHF
ncbi:MAG: type II toxin-antitoxin system RelE/ParE family toxin [Gammaproteobacteria bacterium]|jgi:toxin ParE1/3/4